MLDVILDCLPQSRSFLSNLRICTTDSVFTAPQPIWAELLTEVNWYRNGCASYARPSTSLRKIEVFSESDLLTPASLILPRSIVVNLPILKPTATDRVWFSDGSLPINKVVAPGELRGQLPYSKYVARPYTSVVTTSGSIESLALQCIAVEETRLNCAMAICEQDFSRMFLRITLFDQLSHLLGVNFLRCKDLIIYPAIARFMNLLDEAISRFTVLANDGLFLFSAFSHVACRGTINLNKVLSLGGFFSTDMTKSKGDDARSVAAQAVYKFMPVNSQTSALDPLVNSSSAAYSPMAGCVFINREGVFDDGVISINDFPATRAKVFEFLKTYFDGRFGRSFTIVENPISKFDDNLTPDFVLKIEGVEFNNVRDYAPTPRTSHSSEGFLMGPHSVDERLKLAVSEIGALMQAC